jgi:hypothetical protein
VTFEPAPLHVTAWAGVRKFEGNVDERKIKIKKNIFV